MASEKQVSEKQFKEKLKILNEEFLDFISSAFEENQFYDFTPSVTDYLNHVKKLDDMYAEKPTERKIVVAKRRLTTPAVKPSEKPKGILKATVPEPKKLSNGLVEPVGQFAFASKVQMPEIPSAQTPMFSAPKSTDVPTPSSQSRKRRQEPLNYDDMRNKSSDDYGKAEDALPPKVEVVKHGEPAAAFSTKFSLFGGSAKSSETTSTNTNSLFGGSAKSPETTITNTNSLFGGLVKPAPFSFNLKGPENSTTNGETKTKDKEEGDAEDAPPQKVEVVKHGEPDATFSTKFSLFGGSAKSPETTSTNTNSLFGGSAKSPETTSTNINSLFGGSAKSPETTSTNTNSLFGGSAKSLETTSTNTNSLFGGLVKPAPFSFNLKGPENSTTNGETKTKDDEEGDAEDAPPPKVEVVRHEEPGAAFSTKCSLFNFVNGEYKKVGVGFLHIKKTDSGTQLLIRAATALGTVWVNTYINDSFKAEKKAKDKIQFSYPSTEGAKTSLVRVVDAENAVAYLTGEKKPE